MILFERQTSDETPRSGVRPYHGYTCMCRCAGYSLRGGRLKGKGKGVLVARETQGPGRARSLFSSSSLPSRFSRALTFQTPATQAMKGMVLKQFTLGMGSWPGIYKSESLGLEQSIIFQETDQLVADFSQGNWELPLKIRKNSNRFCFWLDCASDFGSFWKTATLVKEECAVTPLNVI